MTSNVSSKISISLLQGLLAGQDQPPIMGLNLRSLGLCISMYLDFCFSIVSLFHQIFEFLAVRKSWNFFFFCKESFSYLLVFY